MTSDAPASDDTPRPIAPIVGALIGFCLGYALPGYAHLALPLYDPLARTWSWTRMGAPLPISYYGLLLFALLGAISGATLGAALARVARSPRALTLATAWSLSVVTLVAAYFAWNNWP